MQRLRCIKACYTRTQEGERMRYYSPGDEVDAPEGFAHKCFQPSEQPYENAADNPMLPPQGDVRLSEHEIPVHHPAQLETSANRTRRKG